MFNIGKPFSGLDTKSQSLADLDDLEGFDDVAGVHKRLM